jgi:hypothetical protein
MGKVATQARLPTTPQTAFEREMVNGVTDITRAYGQQINLAAEGRIAQYVSATDTAPGGTGAQGDFAPNKAPVVLGSPGSQYIVLGWRYVGTAWIEVTELTDG